MGYNLDNFKVGKETKTDKVWINFSTYKRDSEYGKKLLQIQSLGYPIGILAKQSIDMFLSQVAPKTVGK